jgi:hypothetical protein
MNRWSYDGPTREQVGGIWRKMVIAWAIGWAIGLALIATCAKGQTIPFTIPQNSQTRLPAYTLSNGPTFYNAQYVLWGTDFGFQWANTELLTTGQIQVESKCGPWLPPVTNYFAIGDCNGLGPLRTSGAQVEGISNGGNCAARLGCPPAGDIATRWFFDLGTWRYTHASNSSSDDIPNGTQRTDLQGRTWTISFATKPTYVWIASPGGPTQTSTATVTGTPPTPTATATMAAFTPTATRTAIGQPTPTPTTCSNVGAPWGRVGPFLACYDCAGNPTGGTPPPNPKPGDICLAPSTTTATRTPTLTRAATSQPTSTSTATPGVVTSSPTPTPTSQVICIQVTTTPARVPIVVKFRTPQ